MEPYLQELKYQLGQDPGPWIEKMKHVQEVYGYDDARMILLAELCTKKPVSLWIRKISQTNIKELYAGFRRFYELGKRVSTEKALKWALLHVGCKGRHNPKNVIVKGIPRSSSSSEAEEEIKVTGGDGMLRFPEYSFPIGCGFGDICVNDVLKFDQSLVYNNMSLKVGKVGKAYKRTVVGRVMYEAEAVEATPTHNGTTIVSDFSQSDEGPSYTIEVYWSRGVKPMCTSKPFVIKVHSLELLKPVRQRWGNEQNRVREMEKKHCSKLESTASNYRKIEVQKNCRKVCSRVLSTRSSSKSCTKLVY